MRSFERPSFIAVLVCLVPLLLAVGLEENEPFQRGVALYEELEYERAIIELQDAATPLDLPDKERATIFVWLALSYAGKGDGKSADQAFVRALRYDPTVSLPRHTPSGVAERFGALRANATLEAPAPQPAAPIPAPASAPTANAPEALPREPAARAPAADPSPGPPWLLVAGAGAGAVAAVSMVAGVGAWLAAFATFDEATRLRAEPGAFQSDVAERVSLANAQGWAGNALMASAVVLSISAVALGVVHALTVGGAQGDAAPSPSAQPRAGPDELDGPEGHGASAASAALAGTR